MPEELLIEGLPPQPVPFATQLSNNDQRFTACVTDANGRVLVSWHDERLRIVICELVAIDGRQKLQYVAGPVPTSDKCSCVTLAIPADGTLVVLYGARTEATGGNTGPFPLLCQTYTIPWIKSVSGEFARIRQEMGNDGANSAGLEGRVQALETVFGQLSERVSGAGRALVGS